MIPRDFITAGIGLLVGLGTSMTFMFGFFETIEAAERWRDSHSQAIVCETVNDLEKEKREYETRLDFDPNLTPKQVKRLEKNIEDIKQSIKTKDPEGRCSRE